MVSRIPTTRLWLAAVLLVPAAAWAHATLRDVSPGFQKTLSVSPRRIVLDFDQYVSFPGVQVYDSKGKFTHYLKSARRAKAEHGHIEPEKGL